MPDAQTIVKGAQKSSVTPSNAELRAPQVDGFKVKGSLKGSLKEVSDLLRTLSFLEVAQEKEAVNAVYVESRDINKSPYLFSVLKIKEDEVELLFSIPQEIAPKKRKLDMVRYLINIISLLEQVYKVDNKLVYQLIENSIKEMGESVTLDYSKLYTAYDTLKKEIEDMRKKTSRLTEENKALTTRNYDLKNKNDELLLAVKDLQNMSDETLKSKLQEWVIEHNGELNLNEFAKLYKVNESRVEQALNRLVSEGYLEATQ